MNKTTGGTASGSSFNIVGTSGRDDCRQVLALEIESGHFTREILLNCDVNPDLVTARQDNGLLWISLPFANA